MTLNRVAVELPINGVSYGEAPTLIDPRKLSDVNNMVMSLQGLRRRTGYVALGADLDEIPHLFDTFIDDDQSKTLLCITKAGAWKLGASDVWADIKSGAYTGADDYPADGISFWDGNAGESKYIFTNGVDAPQVWNGTGNFAALGGTPPKGRKILYYAGRIVLFWIDVSGTESPFRFQWTGVDDMTDWAGAGAGSQDIPDMYGQILAAERLGGDITVYSHRSIHRISYIGGTLVFKNVRSVEGQGAISGRAVVPIGDLDIHLVAGPSGFYEWDGGRVTNPIDDPDVRGEAYATLDRSKADRVFGVDMKHLGEAWWFWPTGDGTFSDDVWIYNYLGKTWSRYKLSHDISAAGVFERRAALTWDTAETSWDNANISWDDALYGLQAPTAVLGEIGGIAFEQTGVEDEDNGTAITGTAVTKEFIVSDKDHGLRYFRVLGLTIEAQGNSVGIYYSVDEGQSWVTIDASLTLSASFAGYQLDFDVMAKRIKFKFEAAADFTVRRYEIITSEASLVA